MLRALAEGRIPGVPSNLRVLLLGQTLVSAHGSEGEWKAESADGGNVETVLRHVVSSNAGRERALREAQGDNGRFTLSEIGDYADVLFFKHYQEHSTTLRTPAPPLARCGGSSSSERSVSCLRSGRLPRGEAEPGDSKRGKI